MTMSTSVPSVVLLCQHDEAIDLDGLSAWIAASMRLVGLVVIHDDRGRRWRAVRAEYRRTGWLGLADVVAFRLVYALTAAGRDRRWVESAVRRLRATYGEDRAAVPRLDVADPNSHEARRFLERCAPDLAIARCRRLLVPAVFTIPTHGTFVLHPGICPEYRNAHGCFWALANRDLDRVGMTLLRVDAGIDTGPVYLQAACAFDELRESHVVIQYRAVLDNLEAVAATVRAVCHGAAEPLALNGRRSATWGQPWLSAHLKWKRAARAQWRRSCA